MIRSWPALLYVCRVGHVSWHGEPRDQVALCAVCGGADYCEDDEPRCPRCEMRLWLTEFQVEPACPYCGGGYGPVARHLPVGSRSPVAGWLFVVALLFATAAVATGFTWWSGFVWVVSAVVMVAWWRRWL